MKKLYFLILFFGINILTFSSNVYFLNSGTQYVYTNGQTFNSGSTGTALVWYQLWADPARYSISEWGARFQDPDGNWSDWSHLPQSHGLHSCPKAGTWHVQGRVWVEIDYTTYAQDFYMYTSFTLNFDAVDNYDPAAPSNLTIGESEEGDEYAELSWTANTELDLKQYNIYRKDDYPAVDWRKIGTADSDDTSYKDTDVTTTYRHGEDFWYKITAEDINDNESSYSSTVEIEARLEKQNLNETIANTPEEYLLYSNYPNPFNPSTNIEFQLSECTHASLIVYNLIGEKIAVLVNDFLEKGQYAVQFNASNLPSGIYLYRLKAGAYQKSRKMLLTK